MRARLTKSHLCKPLFLGEVVPLVDPASPRDAARGKLLVVLQHPVVVLHEDCLPLRHLGLGVVLPPLLLGPVEEDILIGQADSHQDARQQMEPLDQS